MDEKGNKENVSNKFNEVKKYDVYEVSNAKFKMDGTYSVFTAELKNTSNETQKGHLAEIVFLDKKGNEMSKMGIYIREMKAGAQIVINATISDDLVDTFDYKLQKK
ncbi:hypothetical protein D3C73_1288020 [compost metagenome]